MATTTVTRVTHSCHLIEIGGRTFLTDPWFSDLEAFAAYRDRSVPVIVAETVNGSATSPWPCCPPTACRSGPRTTCRSS
jgi:L-ascorbate metabolism protein UlaG (beta-lactamase superfamily)